jgi:membrane-associated phospholipid phosphatase
LIIPLAVIIAAWLLTQRSKAAGGWWVTAVIACFGLTALLKVASFACLPHSVFRGPSGHASQSLLTYGVLIIILVRHIKSPWVAVAVFVGSLLITSIAVTRVILGAHTILEVVAGLSVGALALMIFARGYASQPHASERLAWMLGCVFLAAAALSGKHMYMENLFSGLGRSIAISTPACD